MAEQDSDLSEDATPHKLDEARKKGSVAKSPDLTVAIVLFGLVVTIYGSGWNGLRQVLQVQRQILGKATRLDWSADGVAAWMGGLASEMLHVLSPLFLTVGIAAVLANLVQTGPIFSFHPLKPDLERLSPATGFKRLFSLRILYETGKSLVKLVVLSSVAYFLIAKAIPGLIGLPALDPKGYARELIGLTGSLLAKLVLTLFALALLDVLYTRWEFGRRMRMSKRDVKDESKNREGDPRIRARIRELRREVLKRSKAMQKLPGADVLVTNPTHLAVALSYEHGRSGAPQVVAKGAGEMAQKMRELARLHRIPVVQNRILARALFREVENDGYVPEKWYPQVAKIMVWVYAMRDANRASGKAV
jgi:flagellar biosynthetic protein FlhB